MNDDAHLLQCYLENRSQEAFTALVERHLGLVYHAAARQLGRGATDQAEDVAQAVFVLLAEKARSLRGHPSLAGWLHTATRFKVAEWRRAEMRRRKREEAVHAMSDVLNESAGDAEWAQLRPVIDEVLGELSAADREAVLLRFFEGRSFAEIGGHLRLNEKSAHKRVERALEKVRGGLRRRGIFSTAALATVLGSQAGMAAPAGLVASVSGAAAAAVIAPVSAAGALLGAIHFMTTTKTVVGIAVVALTTTGVVLNSARNAEREVKASLDYSLRRNADLDRQLEAARQRAAEAERKRGRLEAEYAARLREGERRTVAEFFAGIGISDGTALLQNYPELKAALTKAKRSEAEERLRPLFAALRLNPTQVEQFLEIELAGRSTQVGDHRFKLYPGEASERERGERLKVLLGEEGFRRYQDYQRAAPGRSITDRLASVLYYTSPLSEKQAAQIQAIVGRNYSSSAQRDWLSAEGWNELNAFAEKSLPAEQRVAIDGMHADRLFYEVERQARDELKRNQSATRSTP